MRSLQKIRLAIAGAAAAALSGCLISETPVLDAKTGRATPIAPGAYEMCAIGDDAKKRDCENFAISIDETNAYQFDDAGDEAPAEMRLRRVGRNGYAAQLIGENDDGYSYYYLTKAGDDFTMTLMICSELPEGLRADLIESGGLSAEDGSTDVCGVNTVAALAAAARAYHRGKAQQDEAKRFVLQFSPIE